MHNLKTQKLNIILIIFLLIGISPQINSEETNKEKYRTLEYGNIESITKYRYKYRQWDLNDLNDLELMKKHQEYCNGSEHKTLKGQLGINYCTKYQLSRRLDDLQYFLSFPEIKKLHEQLTRTCQKALKQYEFGTIYPFAVDNCEITIIDYLLHKKKNGVKGYNGFYKQKNSTQLILELNENK